ncbi:AAA family ATPase [Corynebacterium sp. zg254]|uniref:AAA family ATPase n=4 Tax=Corynebacteriaceae TaxID=1653 RepID=A0ABQ6VFV4_9CORY|nr:AAA family ATPase [Corynebacterium zhongnanshanii]MCR5913832.1 AAA family ATPase [Corynebacterium sp. zg254]
MKRIRQFCKTLQRNLFWTVSVPSARQCSPSMLVENILPEARRLLAESVVTNRMIEQLMGSTERSRWVQEGMRLHEELDECLSCGHSLTQERRDALNVHFDESVKNLQVDFD